MKLNHNKKSVKISLNLFARTPSWCAALFLRCPPLPPVTRW